MLLKAIFFRKFLNTPGTMTEIWNWANWQYQHQCQNIVRESAYEMFHQIGLETFWLWMNTGNKIPPNKWWPKGRKTLPFFYKLRLPLWRSPQKWQILLMKHKVWFLRKAIYEFWRYILIQDLNKKCFSMVAVIQIATKMTKMLVHTNLV